MNVYFACAITGGREDEPVYQAIVAALERDGHTIPTSHLASSEVVHLEKVVTAHEVFSRDIEWIRQADVLVAEVSTPSHGVGYEIAYALGIGKRVLCCFRSGQPVSKMITGNTHPNLQLAPYHSTDEAVRLVRAFVS